MTPAPDATARFADRFAAMGNEPRLRILRLLLAAYPGAMPAGAIQAELGIPASTLSHHLEKLKSEDLATATRRGATLLYAANAPALAELLAFLYDECCTRSTAVEPGAILQTPESLCLPSKKP